MADETEKADDILAQARKDFERAEGADFDNRQSYREDIEFVRARKQWDDAIRKAREEEGRPCLTIDKLGPVIRQVVNDARQNKPGIKIVPADSAADPDTAEVIAGLIRNIEYTSNADIAYDTAVDNAVSGNVGYIRAGLDYAHSDAFDLDITIQRVANPLSVYPDPDSTAADSSDWNVAFVVEKVPRNKFRSRYPKAQETDWTSDAWTDAKEWLDEDGVRVAEYWTREEYEKTIVRTVDGKVFAERDLTEDPDLAAMMLAGLIQLETDETGQPLRRVTKCWKVMQRILTHAEVLEEREWPGQYIPIIPVYGDEFWIDGKRYLRSLINPARDAQMMFNVMRSTSVELFGLAPKVPFLVAEGSVDNDPNWQTANRVSHPYLEYKGMQPPIRLPIDPGTASGAMTESMAAADDIKAITGLYDASLGQRSNETSGKAIMARQREGDVSNFHFIDNLARGIRHLGRVILDLIPKVYTSQRIIRVMGEDGTPEKVPVGQKFPKVDPETGRPMQQPVMGPNGQPMPGPDGRPMMETVMAIHDLTVGKYDVVVSTGPGYTTLRQEAANGMTEIIRAYPPAAPIIAPELFKNLDWPGADKIAEKFGQQGQIPPEVKELVEAGKQKIAQLEQENQQLKAGQQAKMAEAEADAVTAKMEAEIEARTKIAVANINAAAQAEVAEIRASYQAMAQAARPVVVQPRITP